MADITLATPGTRQKASTTNTLNPPLVITNTINDASDLLETFIRYEDLAPNPATFTVASCTVTSGSATVSKTSGFANVRVGDAVSGTGIPVGAKVLSKTDDSTITLSANATATGTPTLTFTPPTMDATMLVVRKSFSMTGATLNMTLSVYKSDGTKSKDVNADGVDDVTVADLGDPVLSQVIPMDLDAWLTAIRVARGS